jgi:predicted PurR-regulated permease PerM
MANLWFHGRMAESSDDHPSVTSSGRSLTFEDLTRWLGLVILIVLGAGLIWILKPTLLLCAGSFLVAIVLNPFIVQLERRGMNRGLALGLVALVVLAILGLLLWLVVPPFLDQVQQLADHAPALWKRIQIQIEGWLDRYPAFKDLIAERQTEFLNAVQGQVGGVAKFLVTSTLGIFGGLFGAVFGLMLTIFSLTDPKPIVAALLKLAPDRFREPARRSLAQMMIQTSAWARGVLINGAATGITTGLGMWAVGVQPALVFGVLAFFGEFVPIIGSVVAAVPALFVAASQGLPTFGLAALVILFVQQIESNLLIPFVMGKQMNLHPVTILFFTLALGSLLGLAGAILVIPATALIKIVIREFYLRPRQINEARIQRESAEIVSGTATLD